MKRSAIDWPAAMKPLLKKYKNTKHPLNAKNPYEWIVMVVLSAQSTDNLINQLSDKIEEIKTVCWYCDKKAIMNMRLDSGKAIFHGEQIQIDGNESYLPVCRKCYSETKKASLKTRLLKNSGGWRVT